MRMLKGGVFKGERQKVLLRAGKKTARCCLCCCSLCIGLWGTSAKTDDFRFLFRLLETLQCMYTVKKTAVSPPRDRQLQCTCSQSIECMSVQRHVCCRSSSAVSRGKSKELLQLWGLGR